MYVYYYYTYYIRRIERETYVAGKVLNFSYVYFQIRVEFD